MVDLPGDRALHAYCIGDARSGTTSLAAIFATGFRSAHEPERAPLLRNVLMVDEGRMSVAELDQYLRDRDECLSLEFDSSWANYFVMERLAALFPEAKFIQLIRDCYTWVESVINRLSAGVPPDVQDFLGWWFKPERYPYGKGDATLKEMGMYSLECYLTRWKNQVEVPPHVLARDRLLTVRTHEIATSLETIATFLGVPVGALNPGESHRNRSAPSESVLSLVDERYLEDTVTRVCGPTMASHFPEIRSRRDSTAVWRGEESSGD